MTVHGAGLILIAAGFVGGAFFSVVDPGGVRWAPFLPLLAAGLAGVALVQVARRRAATDTTRIASDFRTLEARLRRIVEDVRALDLEKEAIAVHDLPARIDARLPQEIVAFADARSAIRHAWGPQPYADVMSHFAAGERLLNRVWSTGADGWVDEAHAALARSREEFEEALAVFEALKRDRG